MCICYEVDDPQQFCPNRNCANQPSLSVVPTGDGGVNLRIHDLRGKVVEEKPLPNVLAPSDKPTSNSGAVVINFLPDQVSASFPQETSDLTDLTNRLEKPASTRRRLLATTNLVQAPTTPQIASPLICIYEGQAVVFKVFLNPSDRAKSHYPVYVLLHLFNTNPQFDYRPFTELKRLIVTTNYDVSSLVYTFTEPGTFVFADSQVPQRLTIVVVKPQKTLCPRSPGASIWPISVSTFKTFGIRELSALNEETDLAKVLGVLLFLLLVALLLVVVVIVWRPKEGFLAPMRRWKPWHRAFGRSAHLRASVAARVDEAAHPGQPCSCADGARADDFNTRVLYDKLEDQNLHLNCQLAQQVNDLRNFYQRVRDQNDALNSLVKASGAGLGGPAAEAEGSSAAPGHDQDEEVRELVLLGYSPAVAQLMAALKRLLERALVGGQPITRELFEKSEALSAEAAGAPGEDKDKGLLGGEMRERLRLEAHLAADESRQLQALSDAGEAERQRALAAEKERLVRQLRDASPEEAARLLAEYERRVAELTGGLEEERLRQRAAVRARLLRLRRAKEARLRRGEEAAESTAEHAAEPAAEPSPVGLEEAPEALRASECLAEALSSGEAAERALHEAAVARQEMDAVEEHFHAEVEALRGAAADAEAERLLADLLGTEERLGDEREAARQHLADLLGRRQAERRRRRADQLAERQAAALEATGEPEVAARLREEHAAETAALAAELDAQDERERHLLDADAEARRLLEELDAAEAALRAQADERQRQLLDRLQRRQRERRDAALRALAERHAAETAAEEAAGAALDPGEAAERMAALRRRQEAEVTAEEAEQDRLDAEEAAAVAAAARDELRTGLERRLEEGLGALSPDAAAAFAAKLRADGEALDEALAMLRLRQENELERRLAARRNRALAGRQEDAEAAAAKAILGAEMRQRKKEEEAPALGAEEAALRKNQEAHLDALARAHAEEVGRGMVALQDEMSAERERVEGEQAAASDAALHQLRQRQAAELDARTDLSQAELEALLAQHAREERELSERLERDRGRARASLEEALARRRARAVAGVRRRQAAELAREQLEQAREANEARDAAREAEARAEMARRIDDGVPAEQAVAAVLAAKQAQELRDLEAEARLRASVRLDEALAAVGAKFEAERASAGAGDEAQEARLARRQALEEAEARARAEKESRGELTRAKLQLKAKHYQEFADALKAHQAGAPAAGGAAQSATEQANRLAQLRVELERQEAARRRQLDEEMRRFEADERQRMADQLAAYRRQVDEEEGRDRTRHKQQLEKLEQRRNEVADERRRQVDTERARLRAEGVPEHEQERLLAKLRAEADKALAKMDAEKLRMQSNLEQRLQQRRRKKLAEKEENLSQEAAGRRQDFVAKQEQAEAAAEAEAADEDADQLASASPAELLQLRPPEEDEEAGGAAAVEPLLAGLPDALEMAAPLEEEDYIPLLMRSPLFQKLDHIRGQLEQLAKGRRPEAGRDRREEEWDACSKLHVCKEKDLEPRHLVCQRIGQALLDQMAERLGTPKLRLKLARTVPANHGWKQNAFRNSVHLSRDRSKLYVRLERLDSVGEFLLILAHFAAHMKLNQMEDDTEPEFVRLFQAGLALLHSRLFALLCRPDRSLLDVLTGGDEDAKIEAQAARRPMLLLPSTTREGVAFNPAEIEHRRRGYRKFGFGVQGLWHRLPSDTAVGRPLSRDLGATGERKISKWTVAPSLRRQGLAGEAAYRAHAVTHGGGDVEEELNRRVVELMRRRAAGEADEGAEKELQKLEQRLRQL